MNENKKKTSKVGSLIDFCLYFKFYKTNQPDFTLKHGDIAIINEPISNQKLAQKSPNQIGNRGGSISSVILSASFGCACRSLGFLCEFFFPPLEGRGGPFL